MPWRACAYRIPHRLNACGLVSGVGPVSVFVAFLARWLPWILTRATRPYFADQQQAQQSLARFARRWVEPDRNALHQPGISDLMGRLTGGSLPSRCERGSVRRHPARTLVGLRHRRHQLPTIHLWHGEHDKQIPVSTARAVAGTLPRCQATFFPDEGHISTIVNHAEEIVRSLTTGRLA
jgi:pimeloyl-ACP methyl ester carboxylesterase